MPVSFIDLGSLFRSPNELRSSGQVGYMFGQCWPPEEIRALWHMVPRVYLAYVHQERRGISVALCETNMFKDYLLIEWDDTADLATWQWTLAELVRMLARQNIDLKPA